MIPDSFKQDLLSRADIVAVVSRYVDIKKAGRDYKGPCPFHDENTPSFHVIPHKQFYHCFGCGKNGDALGFVMDYCGRGFREAVAELAAMVGMQVPDQGPTDVQKVRQDQQNAYAKRALIALEQELYILAIASSDNINGVKPSEEDRARYLQSLGYVLRAIEEAKGRRLSDAERRHILGDELKEQQQSEVAA